MKPRATITSGVSVACRAKDGPTYIIAAATPDELARVMTDLGFTAIDPKAFRPTEMTVQIPAAT